MDRDELLIEAVREYPCLYNSKIADFKILLKKENAWTAIAALLERTGERCNLYMAVIAGNGSKAVELAAGFRERLCHSFCSRGLSETMEGAEGEIRKGDKEEDKKRSSCENVCRGSS